MYHSLQSVDSSVIPDQHNTSTAEFERLRHEGIRIGTQDLRIASIALNRDAILITRNARDFNLVPTLRILDWSV